jgi:tungstate transport system ATP-binding protein
VSQAPASPPAVLEATGISVVYGSRKVLDVPELSVEPNRVLAIIGPNGSGKTTLLLCLALLLKPTGGQVFYKGHAVPDGANLTQMRRKFAMVFQEPLLLNQTVKDNVSLGLKLRGLNHAEVVRRTDFWLERFGIAHLTARSSRTLSGGEAQRTSLARAFALQPEVLFLDEPFAALDVPTRQSLFGDMINILQETRATTVMVTHDRNEAQMLAHRIAVIMDGRIVQAGTPAEIFSSPASEEIARFVGVENVLEGTILSSRECIAEVQVNGQVIEGVSECRPGGRVNVCIRPEDITISLSRPSSSARNVFAGRITSVILAGALVRLTLDCVFPLIALVTRMSFDELKLEVGKEVFASFKATAIHVISEK